MRNCPTALLWRQWPAIEKLEHLTQAAVENVERPSDALEAQHVVAVGGDVDLVQHLLVCRMCAVGAVVACRLVVFLPDDLPFRRLRVQPHMVVTFGRLAENCTLA